MLNVQQTGGVTNRPAHAGLPVRVDAFPGHLPQAGDESAPLALTALARLRRDAVHHFRISSVWRTWRTRRPLKPGSNILGGTILGGFLDAEGKDSADKTERGTDKERRASVLRNRLPHIEHEEPSAQKGTKQARGAAGRLHDSEGATLPAALDQLRR
jgi:hypothetical protein